MRDIFFKYRDFENNVLSLHEMLIRGEIVGKRPIIRNKYSFNRQKFNAMDYGEQKEYFKKLNTTQRTFEIVLKDETMIQINKKQFDELEVETLPEENHAEKY